MCEILAPAGDKNSALAAINSGADAIYLGLRQFSARSSAANFDLAEFKKIVNYAHLFGVRVHVALNTLIKQDEVKDFISSACEAWNAGADALIIQDIFLGRAIHSAYPKIVLHLSTQAGICNEYGARLAKEFGFSRVILARETAFEDIKKIARIIETETFVQGALCTCFSGQCYLSSFAGGNSGNRGRCKQPCRKLYSIDRSGFEDMAYRISPSDLSVGDSILKLKDAGVYSFKIEGRMRRPEYVAAAVGYYRSVLRGEKGDISALKRTYNRGNYTKGLAFGQDKSFLSPAVQGHIGEYVGTVKVVDGKFFCESGMRFARGDGFKILRSGREVCGGIFDGDSRGGFYINASKRLKNGDKVFVTTDTALNARLSSVKRSLPVKIQARFCAGERPRVCMNGVEYVGDCELGVAQNRPLTADDIAVSFKKVGELPFDVQIDEIVVDGAPYLGMSALNSFRRAAYGKLVYCLTRVERLPVTAEMDIPAPVHGACIKSAVIASDLNGVCADIGILKPEDYSVDFVSLASDFRGEKFLYLPAFLSGKDIDIISSACKYFDGIYCEGTYAVALAKELKKPLFAGVGFNVFNTFSVDYLKDNVRYFCVSKELTSSEIAPLNAPNAFALAAGGIKVMDLIYCPFGKTCSGCDRRNMYTLTDEAGRRFPMRRYEIKRGDGCRFELFNCANLVADYKGYGRLFDFTQLPAAELTQDIARGDTINGKLKDITRGHFNSPIL